MSVKIFEGVFESYGPNQSDHSGRKCDYIDIGGQRLPAVNWDMSVAYVVENSLGKQARIAFYKDNWGYKVAAIEVDGRITKSTFKPDSNMSAAIIFGVLFGGFASLVGAINYKDNIMTFLIPVTVSLIPSVFMIRSGTKNQGIFEGATKALD
jgi:hypothetical protein